jgi:hypothetical protein
VHAAQRRLLVFLHSLAHEPLIASDWTPPARARGPPRRNASVARSTRAPPTPGPVSPQTALLL